MNAPRLLVALAFSSLGLGCVWALGPVTGYATAQFLEAEPVFFSPIRTEHGVLRIRKDINGKGHFGASRNGNRTHQGIDLLSPIGDPAYASKSGRVVQAGWQKGYGGVVKIAHPDQTLTVYAHLSRLHVRAGQWIVLSTPIGRIGKSGNASAKRTLPHLHFELRRQDKPINPTLAPLDPHLKLL